MGHICRAQKGCVWIKEDAFGPRRTSCPPRHPQYDRGFIHHRENELTAVIHQYLGCMLLILTASPSPSTHSRRSKRTPAWSGRQKNLWLVSLRWCDAWNTISCEHGLYYVDFLSHRICYVLNSCPVLQRGSDPSNTMMWFKDRTQHICIFFWIKNQFRPEYFQLWSCTLKIYFHRKSSVNLTLKWLNMCWCYFISSILQTILNMIPKHSTFQPSKGCVVV